MYSFPGRGVCEVGAISKLHGFLSIDHTTLSYAYIYFGHTHACGGTICALLTHPHREAFDPLTNNEKGLTMMDSSQFLLR